MRNYRNEVWKPYKNELLVVEDEYLISNYGRVQRKKIDKEDWELSKTSLVGGYDTFWVRKKGRDRSSYCYTHRIVAELFCDKKEDQVYVIHLNFDKLNNESSNLKWVNKSEMFLHHKKNPKKLERFGKRTYSKLTEGRVRLIKKKIFDPNRKTRLKMIAKQFGISEMQLYRIKSGENWGSVKIDIEDSNKD
ncbi:HNH endonuclease [Lutibacter citreus]|uniref:HNH endonuclease n=1 Tax=Lutibacter citreus TaxID=2138210 RepID=UPI000DBE5134|nr:HNH endonuclease [Lutibacter citreus]